MAAHDTVLDAVGGTPLVRLHRIAAGLPAAVWVKLEYLNPGGSVKDRAALAMVRAAEDAGRLRAGATIVEASSGNTGIGLAQAAAVRAYRMVVVLPDSTAVEKLDALRAYGAEVVLAPSALPREDPRHVERLAAGIAERTPGGWLADQYGNPANPAVHHATTGPEIWRDTGGTVTHLVASIGTGGTISGTGRHLKEVSAGRVVVIGADPLSSRYSGGDGSPFAIEAAGRYRHPDTIDDVWPRVYDRSVVDAVHAVPDRTSIHTMRALARDEGLLVGPSSGTAVAAALAVAGGLGPEHTVVAILPDSGRAYLSKHHSTSWLLRNGFLDGDLRTALGAFVTGPSPRTVGPHTTVAEAREQLAGVQQPFLPIAVPGRDASLPVAASEVLGVVGAAQLAGAPDGTPVSALAGAVPPSAGVGETVADGLLRADGAGGDHLLVLRDARLAGIVSRADLAGGAPDGAAP